MGVIDVEKIQKTSTLGLMMAVSSSRGHHPAAGAYGAMANNLKIGQLWNRAQQNDALARKFVDENPEIFSSKASKEPAKTAVQEAAESLVEIEERIVEQQESLDYRRRFLLGLFSEEELAEAEKTARRRAHLNDVSRGTEYRKLPD
ncbi:hypothetical protein ACDP95_10810 [Weissella confusa]|uniref:Uncharacterized protein n=1 Tax=Weissella confusa TaxID=1583 RepID=A0A4Z0S0E6_WEICO|nr:hypothetical protein [Weissella confusa]TGE75920.1 hypothetical protein C6P11_00190 [Weissella confusa]